MKHLGHLLVADLRRHRLLLLAWLLTVVASAVLEGIGPSLEGTPRSRALIALLSATLWCADVGLGIVMVPLVVQTHPLVGSDAFWLTRPIPRLTMLASKAVLLGVVLVLVPVLADIALMTANAVPPDRLAGVAAQELLFKSLWVIALAAAAVLTGTLARFALLCGGTLLVLAVTLAVLLAFSVASAEDSVPMIGTGVLPDPTGGIVLAILAAIAGVALVVTQYFTRRRPYAVLTGAAGLAVAFIATTYMSWTFLAPIVWTPPSARDPARFRLSVDPETARIETSSGFRSKTVWRLVTAKVALSGIEPSWSAEASPVESTLDVDGRIRKSIGPIYPQPTVLADEDVIAAQAVVRRLLGSDRVVAPKGTPPRATLLVLTDADFNQLPPSTGSYRAVASVRLTHHEIDAVMPLSPGATYQRDAHRFTIDRIDRRTAAVAIAARISDAGSVFTREPPPQWQYYLRNPNTREAIVATSTYPDEMPAIGLLPFGFQGLSFGSETGRPSGFAIGRWVIMFEPFNTGRDEPPSPLKDAWLQSAELVVVRATSEGSVERALEIHALPVRTAPAAQAQ